MFVVSEVHPFDDGNGRIARIMMNSELVAKRKSKIIVPNVFREDYMLALRNLTRRRNPKPFIRMMNRVHEFSHWLEPQKFDLLHQQLKSAYAFKDPEEGFLLQWK
ncbi:MAG: Fic family protein [Saprospiraceae bacterium]|nr:Fic family protein [Saprospiraceae bacterium]